MASDLKEHAQYAHLLAELRHRVRGTLNVSRMIVRRSAETAGTLESFVSHLDGRLAALASVQNVIIRDPLDGIDLGMLVTQELTATGLGADERVTIDGQPFLLHPRGAESFALALHELTTNSIKFGALSVPDGQLTIHWNLKSKRGSSRDSQTQSLVFSWAESNIQSIDMEPRHKGFGTIVLTELLNHNLGAHTVMDFTPRGLICRIIVPYTEQLVMASPTQASDV